MMMRTFLIAFLLSIQLAHRKASANNNVERILLIGDSIDRLICHDYCVQYGEIYGKSRFVWGAWGDHSIKYGDGQSKMPSSLCQEHLENGTLGSSLSSLHVFGSAPFGPYPYINIKQDPFAATVPRIAKAFELYFQQIGIPTRVIINTVLWDTRHCDVDEGVGM